MAGYTRQAAANITTGSVIDADDFNDEYNQIQSAFNAGTGHSHDGTAGEGAPIETIGPSQDLVVTASQVRPKTTNALDLGTSALQFKDGHFDGTVKTDGLTVDENATVTGNVTVGGNMTVTGNISGTIPASSVTNITTTNISEGNNQYHTPARARAALQAGSGINYDANTGTISTSGSGANNPTINLVAGTSLTGGGSFSLNQSGAQTITFNYSAASTTAQAVGSLHVGVPTTTNAGTATYTHSAGSNYSGSSILGNLPGTWRCISPSTTSQVYVYSDNSYYNYTYFSGLYERIS